MNPIFEMPEGWEQPSERIQRLAKKIIEDIIARDLRNRIKIELLLTQHFTYSNINFKMYLN